MIEQGTKYWDPSRKDRFKKLISGLEKVCDKANGRHQNEGFAVIPVSDDKEKSAFAVIMVPSKNQYIRLVEDDDVDEIYDGIQMFRKWMSDNSLTYLLIGRSTTPHILPMRYFYPEHNYPMWVVYDEPFYDSLYESSDVDETLDSLMESMSDSAYSRAMDRINKTYSKKMDNLNNISRLKVEKVRDQMNKRIQKSKPNEAEALRNSRDLKLQSMKDQVEASKEALKKWKDSQIEALRAKKENASRAERKNAKRAAKDYKKLSKSRMKSLKESVNMSSNDIITKYFKEVEKISEDAKKKLHLKNKKSSKDINPYSNLYGMRYDSLDLIPVFYISKTFYTYRYNNRYINKLKSLGVKIDESEGKFVIGKIDSPNVSESKSMYPNKFVVKGFDALMPDSKFTQLINVLDEVLDSDILIQYQKFVDIIKEEYNDILLTMTRAKMDLSDQDYEALIDSISSYCSPAIAEEDW